MEKKSEKEEKDSRIKQGEERTDDNFFHVEKK